MSENEWTKILGWPGYRVYRSEIDEGAKRLRLWVRRKRGNRKLECSGCGQNTGRRWLLSSIECGVQTVESRRRKYRSCRARHRSASASRRRWGWPVRARRCRVGKLGRGGTDDVS